jgi:hypothetical protein
MLIINIHDYFDYCDYLFDTLWVEVVSSKNLTIYWTWDISIYNNHVMGQDFNWSMN